MKNWFVFSLSKRTFSKVSLNKKMTMAFLPKFFRRKIILLYITYSRYIFLICYLDFLLIFLESQKECHLSNEEIKFIFLNFSGIGTNESCIGVLSDIHKVNKTHFLNIIIILNDCKFSLGRF